MHNNNKRTTRQQMPATGIEPACHEIMSLAGNQHPTPGQNAGLNGRNKPPSPATLTQQQLGSGLREFHNRIIPRIQQLAVKRIEGNQSILIVRTIQFFQSVDADLLHQSQLVR